jgi:two-component system CheB/CheR fusion protein
MNKVPSPRKKTARNRKDEPEQPAKSEPTVVGIGASAGGLAALKEFFHHVPANSGLAYVVVVHLSPEHKSHLADLLQPHVQMPVQQVTETMALEADHVYVIPPNANLNTIDTHLRLSELEERRRERAPINHFFRTLASAHDGHAVAVVLTGTGSDGALGIKEIKARGGFVLVQDPKEAEFNGMPQSAIETGLVDLVLPVAEIAQTVLRLARSQPLAPVVSEDTETIAESKERILQKIFAQLRARTERDFSRYKRSTLLRRIGRRMQLKYLESLETYLEKLREEPEEVRALADDLLVPVTNFFRDPDVFNKLEKDVIQDLFKGRKDDDPIRLWSVGCATGEEAYSLAMLLVEEAALRDAHTPIQIFASDLHEPSLIKAREGFYSGDIAVDVSAERLQRFFQMEKGGYRINKEIRDLVIFAPHNVLADPPFSRLDFIACRNLLIYLQREVQRDAIDVFHYALRPEGWLLLGSAETIDAEELFRTEEKKLHLYRKRNVPAPEPRLPVFPSTRPRFSAGSRAANDEPIPRPISSATVLQSMMERHGPPCLLIGRDYKLAQVAGNAGRYLLHPPGEPTHNVFQLVRKELRVELRTVVQAVRDKSEPIDSKPIPVRFNGSPHPVIMHVRPGVGRDQEGFVLVIFEEGGPQHAEADEKPAAGDSGGRVEELEAELETSQRRLQEIFEKFETNQEEMRASNEEMQSANEELRSTMEELETSKEELQSINEELQTVNQENRHKVDELSQLSSVLQNLLAATEIATLFLDRDLRILRFTPRVSELFNVQMTDRGRPLSDLTHRLGYDELASDAREVLSNLTSIEREVRDEAGRCYLTRLLPYRSADDRIEGLVITFVDITRRLQTEEKLRQSEQRYRLLVDNAREYAMLFIDLNGCIASWNAGAERLFGYAEEEIVGRPFHDLFTEEDSAAGVPQAELDEARRNGIAANDGWRVRKDGSRFWGSGAMEALGSPDGELRGFGKVLRDNTERKEAEESLQRLADTLEARVHEQTREVRDLSARLTMAEHRERDRIARILHDDLQQLLYSIKMQIMFLREALGQNGQNDLAERAEKTEQLLGDGIGITQSLAIDLSPQVLEKEGLREMVRWLGDHMKEQHGLEVALKAKKNVPAPKALRVLLFQTVRELLFNVIKHADVKQATVDLRQVDGEFLIRVMDQGKGFDVTGLKPDAGFGVASIGHRISFMGGRMHIDSEPGKGTTVTIVVPLEALDEGPP